MSAAAHSIPSVSADAHRPTVLVVDDDAAVRNSLEFVLEVEGFAVRAFESAAGLINASDWPERGCLIIDYRLPDMNGLDLLDTLRHRGVLLPAILITADPSASIRHRAAEQSIPLVEKPLLGETLSRAVHRAIAHSAKGGAPA